MSAACKTLFNAVFNSPEKFVRFLLDSSARNVMCVLFSGEFVSRLPLRTIYYHQVVDQKRLKVLKYFRV